jgi:hypothetical protein
VYEQTCSSKPVRCSKKGLGPCSCSLASAAIISGHQIKPPTPNHQPSHSLFTPPVFPNSSRPQSVSKILAHVDKGSGERKGREGGPFKTWRHTTKITRVCSVHLLVALAASSCWCAGLCTHSLAPSSKNHCMRGSAMNR